MALRKVQCDLIVANSGDIATFISGLTLWLSGKNLFDVGMPPQFFFSDENNTLHVVCRARFNTSGDAFLFFDQTRTQWTTGPVNQRNRLSDGTRVAIHTCTHDLGSGFIVSCGEDTVQVK